MRRRNIIAIVVVAIVAVVMIGVLAYVMGQTASNINGSNGTNNDPIVPPAADIRLVTKSCDNTAFGDAKFTLKITNVGDAIGSKTYTCKVFIGSNTFTQPLTVTLAPAETKTYTVDIDLPIGNLLSDWTWTVSPSQ